MDVVEDNRARWLSISDITDTLKAIEARHVMVVADNCFSGTLTRSAQRGLSIVARGADHILDVSPTPRRARQLV